MDTIEQLYEKAFNKMKKIILVRGLPGSGKTTLGEKIKEQLFNAGTTCALYSTDDFFVYNNKYNFDVNLLSVAHSWNRGRVIRSMMRNVDVIIVANTFTQAWEVSPYYFDAQKFGYEVEFKQPKTEWAFDADVLFEKNTHGVPLETIKKMIDRWESTETIISNLEENNEKTK
jgi:tRNA uridine 5-carbamoylmethylation protein Kti12